MISSPRLQILPLNENDADIFYQVYSDPFSQRYVGDGKPLTREQSQYWIGVTLNNYQTRGYGMYQIRCRQTRQLIGCIGLVHPDQQLAVEIKYCLLQSFWGQGLASEAVQAMLQFAQDELHITDLVATLDARNAASQRVLQKNGFIYAKTLLEQDSSEVLVYYLGNKNIIDQISQS